MADSIGVNDHAPSNYTQSDFSTVVALEKSLGVRHLRDGILNGMSSYDAAMVQLLNATHAKVDGITDCPGVEQSTGSPTSPASIQSFNSAIGNRLEAVEAPNEPDLRGDSNWVADTINCLPSLRSAVPSVPFYGPALGDPNDNASALGNISSLVDQGNLHRYFSGRNPGTSGWGGTESCGVYGALNWALCLAQSNTGSKPIVITETGYNSQTEVDETTQAKYLSRAFFVNLQAGVARTYIYDLKDNTSDSFGGCGLIRIDDSLKPAYSALKNLIATFSDAGGGAAPVKLAYRVTNSNLAHLLFQKHDGTYVLALWNETASWNVSTNSEISVPSQSETIDLEVPPSSLKAVALDDTGNYVTKATSLSGAAITLPIDDHVTVVSFKL